VVGAVVVRQAVVADLTVEVIVAGAASQPVIAGAAAEDVGPAPTVDRRHRRRLHFRSELGASAETTAATSVRAADGGRLARPLRGRRRCRRDCANAELANAVRRAPDGETYLAPRLVAALAARSPER
jgi:hypothetical protein